MFERLDEKLKAALAAVQKPGRYTGGEPGCVYKERSSGKNKEERPAQRVNGTVHRPFLFAFCAQIRYNDPKTAACAAGRVRGTRPVLAHRALRTLNHAKPQQMRFC